MLRLSLGLVLTASLCVLGAQRRQSAPLQPGQIIGAEGYPITPPVLPPNVSNLGFKVVPDWDQLPTGWHYDEVSWTAIDAQGHVYVFNRGPHAIIEYEPNGKFVRSFGEGLFTRTHGARFDREGNMWAVDVSGHTIFKLDPKGRVQMILGRKGSQGANEDPVHFNRPADAVVAPNGDIYVADGYGNSRVVKFNKDGKFLKAWGKKGTNPGEFNLVHAVALDNRGRVYVGDRENYRIQVFDSEGNFLHQWTHIGSPWGIDITADQRIFMADGHNNHVLVLNLEGQILAKIGSPGKRPGEFIHSHGIAVTPDGKDFYVAETVNWRVQKFTTR